MLLWGSSHAISPWSYSRQRWQCAHVIPLTSPITLLAFWHSQLASKGHICQDNATNFSGRACLLREEHSARKGEGRFSSWWHTHIPRLMGCRCTTAPILTSSPGSKPKDLDLNFVTLLPVKTEEPCSWRKSWWTRVKIILLLNFPVKYLIAFQVNYVCISLSNSLHTSVSLCFL